MATPAILEKIKNISFFDTQNFPNCTVLYGTHQLSV